MAKSPYRRQSRRLLSLAGRADRGGGQPVLEMLEERRLLTVLTVPDADTPMAPALDADGFPEAVFFTYYAQPLQAFEPDQEVTELAVGVRFVLSGTPGASVEIKDLFGRNLFFRPTPESLAPPRLTFESAVESADGATNADGDFVFDPNGSAAYETGTDSIESVAIDVTGDELADLITVNNGGAPITLAYGQGEPANAIDDTPAEPDGVFGDYLNEDEDGNEVPAVRVLQAPNGASGASSVAVADVTPDNGVDLPDIIVTFRDTDNVVVYQNLGTEQIDDEGEEFNFLGFAAGAPIDVGDQPIDVQVDNNGDIWVLNYGDETVQRVGASALVRQVYPLTSTFFDVSLVDNDNDDTGDALGDVGADYVTVGRSNDDTNRGFLSFRLPLDLIDAVTTGGQFVTKVTLLVGGEDPTAANAYDVRLWMSDEPQASGAAAVGDYEDDNKFNTRIDRDSFPFLTPNSDQLNDAGVVYQFPIDTLDTELIQEAGDTGNRFVQFRLDGTHPLFGIDEDLLTDAQLDELNNLAPYLLNARDQGFDVTVPTLTITLSETFAGDDVYKVGEAPTSLKIQAAHGSVPGDPSTATPDMVVTHAGSDDVWVFYGSEDPDDPNRFIFGLNDSDGDGSREPNQVLSTQRPDQFNPVADIDGDGLVDPIGDDSNPWEAAIGDLDLDGQLDIALALRGNMYPGITVTTTGGVPLDNTLIPGGVAVFWGQGPNPPGAGPYVDSDPDRPGTNPDFLQESLLGNQPERIITQGLTVNVLPGQLAAVDPFYRGPSSIEIANMNPDVDLRLDPTLEMPDLIVGSVDLYNTAAEDPFKLAATRGGAYVLTQYHDAQSEYEGLTYGTTPPFLNAPLLSIDTSTIIPGRIFSLPLPVPMSDAAFLNQPPELPPIEYIDVQVANVELSPLDTPLLDQEIQVPDLVVTRSDNASPYWTLGEDPGVARNVQVIWQIEGEPDPLPAFNYGIGSIEFTGADENTRLTITAGTINVNLAAADAYALQPGINGIANFEMWSPTTLEGGPENPEDLVSSGAIRIGAPTLRPFTVDAGEFYATFPATYTAPDQGIKALDGQSIDRIVVDGHVYGRNIIDGSLETFSAGFLGGDLLISGDAGFINIATNSGYRDGEVDDPLSDQKEQLDDYDFGSTNNVIQVGRSLRDLFVGRALYSQVKVLGELGDAEERPPLDALRVVEAESRHNPNFTYEIVVDPASGRTRVYTPNVYSYHRAPGMALQGGTNALGLHHGDPLAGDASRSGMTLYTDGNVPLDNDQIGAAQFLGGVTTAVEVAGWLRNEVGDSVDYYAFAAEGGETVSIGFLNEFLTSEEQITSGQPSLTIEDREGNVLATLERGKLNLDFTAPHHGVFFLRLGASANIQTAPYTMQLQGLAPVTLGQVRTGTAMILHGSGAIQTNGGSIGHLASGGAAVEVDSSVHEGLDGGDLEDIASMISAKYGGAAGVGNDGATSAGNIYGISAAGDVAGLTFNAAGFVGGVTVGYPSFAGDGNEGDWWNSFINAAGLSFMNLAGSFAVETDGIDDPDPKLVFGGGITGPQPMSGGIEVSGSIGTVRIGEHLYGSNAYFIIGDNSMFDQLIVDAYTRGPEREEIDPLGADNIDSPVPALYGSNPLIRTGTGSDVRFIDVPTSLFNDIPGAFAEVLTAENNSASFTDDAGADFTIRLQGATEAATARVYFMEIDGSEGVAVSRIDALLPEGVSLLVESDRQNSVTSIGRIRVASASSNSDVLLRGKGEIDVYRIEGFLFEDAETEDAIGLGRVQNETPGGDLVSVDVNTLGRLEIEDGDLGRTQKSDVGLQHLGAWLGLSTVAPGDIVGDPIWIHDPTPGIGAQFVTPAVSPVDYWLNGLIVRSGDTQRVRVSGAVGDVIINLGLLERLEANSDNRVPKDGFDGIIGSVLADTIGRVEIGSGLIAPGDSQLAEAGIFSYGTLDRVTGKGVGNDIEGLVLALGAIDRIEMKNGASIIGANIGATQLIDWFVNPLTGGGFSYMDEINRIQVKGGGDIFGTQIRAFNLDRIDINQGVWDANVVEVRNEIGQIKATEFTNSLVNGRVDESPHNPVDLVTYFDPDPANPLDSWTIQDTIKYSNFILASRNVEKIQTKGSGDIYDLVMEVAGDLEKIKADDIVRTELGVTTTLQRLDAKGDLLASDILAGDINRIRAKESIRTTTIEAAGAIDRVDARRGEIYNTLIRSDGTDGEIGQVKAKERLLNVQIDSAGPVQKIQARQGDVFVNLTTFGEGAAHLHQVKAGRDIRGSYDVDGDIYQLKAKENIGTDPDLLPAGAGPEFIVATQDLDQVKVGGQIYTEIRVQGAQTGTIKMGDVVVRDDEAMSPSTASFVFAGTVNNVISKGAFNATIESQAGGIGNLKFQENVGTAARFIALDGGINKIDIKGDYRGYTFADENIDNFSVRGVTTGGSVISNQSIKSIDFRDGASELLVHAALEIGSFDARSSLTDATVGAGELIGKARVGGLSTDANFVAGLESLGDDGVLGGGDDTVSSGDIDDLDLAGGSTRVNVLAGWDVGPDGVVDPIDDPSDDSVADGLSSVHKMTAGGVVTDSFLRADTFAPQVPGFDGQTVFRPADPAPSGDAILSGTARDYVFSVNDPDTGGPATLVLTIAYSGPGFVEPSFIDQTGDGFTGDDRLNALHLYGSQGNRSHLVVNSVLSVPGEEDRTGYAHLAVANDFAIIGAEDLSFGTVTWDGDFIGSGAVFFDGNVTSFTARNIDTSDALDFSEFINLVDLHSFEEGILAAREIDTVSILSGFGGEIFAERLDAMNAGGLWTGLVSVTQDIQSVTANNFQGTVRAGGDIDQFAANAAHNAIVSAGDHLGRMQINGDANATTFAAGLDVGADGVFSGDDVLSNGNVQSVRIGGNFTRGSVVAGISRGADGFFGTSDDTYAPGISRINSVTIDGFQVGSNLGNEHYGVIATGDVDNVRVAGAPTGGQRNFEVMDVDTSVLPLRVTDIETTLDGDSYTTRITFDQHINTATMSSAISISNPDASPNLLVEGEDYTLSYDEQTRSILVAFAPHVGESVSPLDQGDVDERPPGVYTITIEADPEAGGLLSRTGRSFLDGDGDGISNGDETEPDFSRGVIVGDVGDRRTETILSLDVNETPLDVTDDFYATLYEAPNLTTSNILPLNEATRLSGIIGNHPDQDVIINPGRLDVDVYAITAEAGDVIKARQTMADGLFSMTLRTAEDYPIDTVESNDVLPVDSLTAWDYSARIADTGELGFRSAGVGDLEHGIVIQADGTYYLTVVSVDVGNYTPNLPPIPFVSHGIINYGFFLSDPGIGDTGRYELELLHFRDGDTGFLDTQPFGPAELIGTPLDTAEGSVTVDGSIGLAGNRGIPEVTLHDADVFLLNGGDPLPAGSVVDVSLLLSELGADLETSATGQSASPLFDSPGVELALFDVTAASSFGDAELVAAPTINRHGDELTGDRDFSYSIVLPGDPDAAPGTPSGDRIYAIMVQGNQQSDYRLQVDVTEGNGFVPQRYGQNVVIETGGGFVDWLEAYGVTELDGFDLSALGMEGQENEVLDLLLDKLNEIFAPVVVNFSTSSAAFEGDDFTTVFLTSSIAPDAFRDPTEYGFNDGVDLYNLNRNQEVVMYVQKFSTVFSTTVAGAPEPVPLTLGLEEELATALANTIAQELGETFGLREMDFVAADYANPNQDPAPNVIGDDAIMVENRPWAWADRVLTWSPDPAQPGEAIQLDPGEFLIGSANSLNQLSFALREN